ncbi:hypothetical protein AB4114_10010 [Paenibacillus sp. 2RAB27]
MIGKGRWELIGVGSEGVVKNLTGFSDVNLIENDEFINITGFPTANFGEM